MRLECFLGLLQRLLRVVDLLLNVRGFLLGLDEGRSLLLDGALLFTNVGVNFGEFALTLSMFFFRFFHLLLRCVFFRFDLNKILPLVLSLILALFDPALVVIQLEQLQLNLLINEVGY